MAVRVIVLNGGSSSGKSTIARQVQTLLLPEVWLTFGIDALIEAMPPATPGIDFRPDGGIAIDKPFRAAEAAWMRGIAATVAAGAAVIVDDVFLGGAASQDRWRAALDGLPVLWVGVHCDPDVAAAREAHRGDRIAGMARDQASAAHTAVHYDLEVDTSTTSAADAGRTIASRVTAG